VTDAAVGQEHTALVIVNEANFAQLPPKIMAQQPVPAGIAGLSAIPYGLQAPELDLKL
jgi:hypothetical protein